MLPVGALPFFPTQTHAQNLVRLYDCSATHRTANIAVQCTPRTGSPSDGHWRLSGFFWSRAKIRVGLFSWLIVLLPVRLLDHWFVRWLVHSFVVFFACSFVHVFI